tara:strand:+ start:791 stop:1717 length:927 start_codon:yes stop_codon:yes gene_type:complete
MIIEKIFRNILDRLFLRKFDDIKIQKGQIFEKNLSLEIKNIKSLNQTYFKVFSQDTEDGILQYLLKSLNINDVKFVEIGTQDYSESNTRYIYETMRCEGLVIDPYPNLEKEINKILRVWKNKLKVHNDFVNSENINEILKQNSFNKDLDLFSIDIDGIDYWVLEKINPKISKIFVIEYNPYFGSNLEISAPNLEKFDRFKYHPSGLCWGASLKAIINLMKKKGYTFIGSNRLNCNSFFILNELLDKFNLNLPSIDNLSEFTDVKFNVLKTKDKKYVSFSDIKNDIKNLEVFDLISNKMVKFDEISQNI